MKPLPTASRRSGIRSRPIHMVFALAAALSLAAGARPLSAHPDGSYPRTFNIDWRNTINAYYGSQFDVMVVNTRCVNLQLDSLKALNPAIKRLVATSYYMWFYAGPNAYPHPYGPFSASDSVFGWDRKFWDLLENNNWWLYAVDSSGVRYHASMAYEQWCGNFTTKCPKNAQGKRLCDVYGDFLADNLLSIRHNDGVFFDYCSRGFSWMNWQMWGNCPYNMNCTDPSVPKTPDTKFYTAFDADNNGQADRGDSLDSWWQQGMNIIMDRLRQRMGPNYIIVGNGNQQYFTANGAMMENYPKILGAYDPWPNPYSYKWNASTFGNPFGYLSINDLYFSMPRYNMIDSYFPDGADMLNPPHTTANDRQLRFTLGSALLGDGYYGTRGGGNQWDWIWPEYNLALGWPTSPYVKIEWQTGYFCYTRTYTNGDVWVNASSYTVPALGPRPSIFPWDAVIRQAAPLAVEDGPPGGASLAPPSPNPMREEGSFRFTLAPEEHASLQIYDARGRLVRDLWTGIGTGRPQFAVWQGDTDLGFDAPAGIYFATLFTPTRKFQQRLVRLP